MSEAELVKRLERLERDNRRFKRLALAAFALPVLGLLYACTAPRNAAGTQTAVPAKIAAHEFDVMDGRGKARVRIAMDCSPKTDCWPEITLLDKNGKALTLIGAGTIGISGEKARTTLLGNGIQVAGVSRSEGLGDIANLGVDMVGSGAALTLSGRGGMSVQLMGQSALPGGEGGVLNLMGKNGNSVYLDSDSPMIEIADGKGGSYMDLGRTGLVASRTGATEQTSAASIVMFGNDKKHHVIWQAPQ
jgi:hypothetical protein